MIAKKNSKKIVKYKKYIGINIGTLLFGIVFVYMMVCIVMYLTSTHIAPYEVKKGSLSGNYKYSTRTEIRNSCRSTGIRSCYLLCKRRNRNR